MTTQNKNNLKQFGFGLLGGSAADIALFTTGLVVGMFETLNDDASIVQSNVDNQSPLQAFLGALYCIVFLIKIALIIYFFIKDKKFISLGIVSSIILGICATMLLYIGLFAMLVAAFG